MTFIIFGASGDLSQRKLLPALETLKKQKMLSEDSKIIAIGRRDMDSKKFVEDAKKNFNDNNISFDPNFFNMITYYKMDIGKEEDFYSFKDFLKDFGNDYIYYFAISPELYLKVANNLKKADLCNQDNGYRRLIIEKPFGHDLSSAKQLNEDLHKCFDESQIFRIDHYLGKETVQNILVTRFANSIFEPLWNRNYIEYVEIIASEELGVGTRAGYYDKAGALRDMVQNHLLQILALVAMEPPVNSQSSSLRNEMVKVFQSLREISYENVNDSVVRAQYVKSKEGKGYREEDNISDNSMRETYVALKCYLDNYRWSSIPFYIRTGKALKERNTEILIHFKENPHKIFCSRENIKANKNVLIIRVQPKEGLFIHFGMKIPGLGFKVQPVSMDFYYSSLCDDYIPKSYERLIYDCILNDSTLYQRSDAIELTWKYVQPILDAWENNPDIPLYTYPVKGDEPKIASELLAEENHSWRGFNEELPQDKCKLR